MSSVNILQIIYGVVAATAIGLNAFGKISSTDLELVFAFIAAHAAGVVLPSPLSTTSTPEPTAPSTKAGTPS